MRKGSKAGIYTRLFALRTMKNMSQRALSAASGISNKTIVGIEKGKIWPRTDTVKDLCEALGVTSEEFYTTDPTQADGEEEERKIA